MTIDEIKDRLESAAYVMRLLPPVRVQGYVTVRLDVIYTPQELSMMDRKPKKPRPTQEQITQMDEALRWLEVLEPWERKLVWKRAERIPWKFLCREYGLSRAQLNIKYDLCLAKIEGFIGGNVSRHFRTRQIAKKGV